MTSNKSTMLQLGYLGLLPFIGGLALVLIDDTVIGLSGQQIFITYSAIILSFLSGVLWGGAIDRFSGTLSKKSLILSNVFALMAWSALLLGEAHYFLATLILAIGFIATWFAEKEVRKSDDEPLVDGYQTLRNRLTTSVVLMHGMLLLIL